MSKTIIGIDLGTTNSEVAVVRDGKLEIVEEAGSPILPSCVGLADDGSLMVGMAARNQYILRPGHTVPEAHPFATWPGHGCWRRSAIQSD